MGDGDGVCIGHLAYSGIDIGEKTGTEGRANSLEFASSGFGAFFCMDTPRMEREARQAFCMRKRKTTRHVMRHHCMLKSRGD